MEIRVTQLSIFAKRLAELLKTHRLKQEDFDAFKKKVGENPEIGDLIQGTGGVRKTRLKSASKGTRGGFRVCYYFHDADVGEIFLITIYSKNEKEDISPAEKQDLKQLADIIKRR